MNTRPLALLALLTLVFTLVWLVQTIVNAEPIVVFEDALAKVERGGPSFTLTYINAALITLFNTMLLAGLYPFSKRYLSETGAILALIFVPVYSVFNFFAYLSQITIVPVLLDLYGSPAQPEADVLLRLMLQEWPQSGAGFFNALAYALAGIPSILYALALYRSGSRALFFLAVFLALSGFTCILGVVGILMKNGLSAGVVAGGGLYTLALIPMTWAFWRKPEETHGRFQTGAGFPGPASL